MGLFDLFKSNNVDARREYLRQLIRVAKADGNLDEKEYEFIRKIAARLETSDEELLALQTDPSGKSGNGPDTAKGRFQFIWDLVWVMVADQEIDVNEVHICSRLAYKLGYHTDIIKEMAEFISSAKTPEEDQESAYHRIFEDFQTNFKEEQ